MTPQTKKSVFRGAAILVIQDDAPYEFVSSTQKVGVGPFFSGTLCIFLFVKIRTLQPSMKKSNLGTNYAFSNSLLTPLFCFCRTKCSFAVFETVLQQCRMYSRNTFAMSTSYKNSFWVKNCKSYALLLKSSVLFTSMTTIN